MGFVLLFPFAVLSWQRHQHQIDGIAFRTGSRCCRTYRDRDRRFPEVRLRSLGCDTESTLFIVNAIFFDFTIFRLFLARGNNCRHSALGRLYGSMLTLAPRRCSGSDILGGVNHTHFPGWRGTADFLPLPSWIPACWTYLSLGRVLLSGINVPWHGHSWTFIESSGRINPTREVLRWFRFSFLKW